MWHRRPRAHYGRSVNRLSRKIGSVWMLRAIFVILAILIGIRYSLKGPFYALLFYLWIAYFRPEYWLWWDFFSQLNLSLIVGIAVLGGTLLSGKGLQLGRG